MRYDFLRTRSIFSLFPERLYSSFNFDQYLEAFTESHAIENEHLVCDHLSIALEVPLLLMKKESSGSICIGSVIKGRSANLFSFLRALPSRYSVRARSAGQVLRIPRSVLDSLFNEFPEAKIYLLRVTESGAFRNLSRELHSLNLNPIFIAKFIAKLNIVTIPHHEPVVSIGESFTGPLFLSEGEFLFRHKTSTRTSWSVPLRTWIGWGELKRGDVAGFSITAMSESELLQIQEIQLNQLSEEFPKDYQSLESWILEGVLPQIQDEDDEYSEIEDDDLEDLFKGADETAVHHWSFPFVGQNDAMDCGPACLAMMSLYFKKDLSIQFWRSKLSTGKEGTTLYDLAQTAERFGFTTYCLEVVDLKELESNLFPFIAIRKKHYLVVYKIEKDFVTIGNPEGGILKLSIENFNNGFENVGLFLKPNSQFAQLTKSQSRWKHYVFLFEGVKTEISLAFICGLIGVLVSLAPPAITQLIIDNVLVSHDLKFLTVLLSVLVGTTLVSMFAAWARSYYFNFVITRFNFRAMNAFIQKMLSLPYNFFATRNVGDFTHRIEELSQLRSFVTGTLFEVVMNIVTLIIYAVALVAVSPTVGLIAFVLAPLMLVIPLLHSNFLTFKLNQLFELRASQTSRVTDLVNGIATIKATGANYASKAKFVKELSKINQYENAFYTTSSNVATLTTTYYQFANLVVVGACALLGIHGELSAGKVFFLIAVSSRIFNPFLTLSRQWDRFIETKMAISRLNDIFLSPSETQSIKRSVISSGKIKGEIEFKEVWFRYGGETSEWVLKDINFKVGPGEKVAFVGPSGSGKSTIACLLSRMYEPTKGNIYIDGRDYREYDLDYLRSQIGLLHQEPTLFAGTIMDNIGFNQLEPDVEKVRIAAKRASITSVIESKPEGLEHEISHGGNGFSKGEKQRIALARLFYNDPQILVLDEATASLDGTSERHIMSTIANEMSERVVFSIAHRLTTLAYSDLIIVLNHGRISGCGTMELLKETNFLFQELFGFSTEQTTQTKEKAA